LNPEAVFVFDLGKVLLDFDYGKAARRLAARCDLGPDAIRQVLDQSRLLWRYETGAMTTTQFFEEVKNASGLRGELAEFRGDFAAIFEPIDAMIELHAELRRAGFPTYIFSNTNEMAITHIREEYPFFRSFSDYILSYEHGAMKPDPALYQVVEDRVGKRGAAIVYLDDRPENIAAGAARGWTAILHTEPAETRTALRAIGAVGAAPSAALRLK